MVAPVRLMLVCFGDDRYHDHAAIGAFLNKFLSGQGFAVTYARKPDAFTPDALRQTDAVVMYAVGASAPQEPLDNLLKAVSGARVNDRGRAVGFAGIHGVTTSFPDSAGFRNMLGASFVSHPDMGPLYRFAVKAPAHPVVAGVSGFRLKDELYFFDTHSPFTVLVSCLHEKIERPVVWIKNYGRGSVFYIALGHGLEQLGNRNVRRLLANGVAWAAGTGSAQGNNDADDKDDEEKEAWEKERMDEESYI
jgi:type 1 glutamine amidotransferase